MDTKIAPTTPTPKPTVIEVMAVATGTQFTFTARVTDAGDNNPEGTLKPNKKYAVTFTELP